MENDGWSALHFAANNGFTEVVKILVENSADARTVNNNGDTARSLADAGNFHDVLDLLPLDPEKAEL